MNKEEILMSLDPSCYQCVFCKRWTNRKKTIKFLFFSQMSSFHYSKHDHSCYLCLVSFPARLHDQMIHNGITLSDLEEIYHNVYTISFRLDMQTFDIKRKDTLNESR